MGWDDDHSKSCHGCSTFDQLTAERDALKAERDRLTERLQNDEMHNAFNQVSNSLTACKADNERLRASMASALTDIIKLKSDRGELLAAAEEFIDSVVFFESEAGATNFGANALREVIAKVSPIA